MEQTNLSRILKLGMAIRYLYKEVQAGTPMYGDRHVIPNIDQVLSTLSELGFTRNGRIATLHGKLKILKEQLNQSAQNAVDAAQAAAISTLFGEIRTAVYAYGDGVQIVESDLALDGDMSFEKLFRLMRRLTVGKAIAAGTTLVAAIGFVFALGQQWHLIPDCSEVANAAAGTRCVATLGTQAEQQRTPQQKVVDQPPLTPPPEAPAEGAATPESVPAAAPAR